MILLTLDTSDESEAAMTTAIDLARRFEQPLQLLLVIDGGLRHHFTETAKDRGTTVADVAQGYLDEAAKRPVAEGVPTTGVFRHGTDAATEILQVLDGGDVALAVMATHGRSGITRLLAGSVTDQVIRHSPVPVVVVPSERPAPEG